MENLVVPINTEELWERYSDPTDFISGHYGNGWNRCGPRAYSFLDEHRKSVFDLDRFSYETKYSTTGAAGELNMFLTSWENGLQVTTNMTVKVSLYEYPTATPYYQFVNVTYRECFPDDFRGEYIEDQKIMVGDDNYNLDTNFNQWPCDYK